MGSHINLAWASCMPVGKPCARAFVPAPALYFLHFALAYLEEHFYVK